MGRGWTNHCTGRLRLMAVAQQTARSTWRKGLQMSVLLLVVVMGVVSILGFLLFKIYQNNRLSAQLNDQYRLSVLDEEAHARAESLLQASIMPHEYAALQQNGYLELPSRLYANRRYHIPRKRRRVQVYEVMQDGTTSRHKILGELCIVACDPVPEADLILTHKWLIEADEERYLATANWINGSWVGGMYV